MGASVPFTLDHVLDAVVGACLRELTASRREVVIVRAATAAERADLEGMIAALKQRLHERDDELDRVRGELLALQALPPVLPVVQRDAKPARLATEAELAEPPQNPRLSGHTTLVGLTFGTWKVVDRAGGGLGLSYWKCVCIKCGDRREIAGVGAFSLRGNRLPWCPKCRLKRKGAKPPAPEAEDDEETT